MQGLVLTRRAAILATGVLVAASVSVGSVAAPVHAGVGSGSPPEPGIAGSGIGVLAAPGEALNHIDIVWDEIIDPTSVPAPSDFGVVMGPGTESVAPTAVRMIYSGFADASFISEGGVSLMRLDLGFSWTAGVNQLTLSYTPGASPVRDLALNEALPIEGREVEAFDIVDFFPVGPIIDEPHGRNRMLLAASLPIDPGSIPAPDDFVVRDGTGTELVDFVLSVTQIHADSGMGVLDLELASTIDDPSLTLTLDYVKGLNPIRSLRDGTELEPFAGLPVLLMLPSDYADAAVVPGGTLTTATADGTSASDPLATSVTSQTGGTVTISEGDFTDSASGYEFFGQQVEIAAPDGSPEAPLVIRFDIDASIVPAGKDATTIEILRNGVAVPSCTGTDGVAEPSPCISSRMTLPDGGVSITVLTVQASTWNMAIALPLQFGGFEPPVTGDAPNLATAGSAVPVKFSLAGFRGLDIFAAGSPSVRSVSCDGVVGAEVVEETVSAGASSLTYDATTDLYTYVWKTDRGWLNTCRSLTLTFTEGTVQSALFDFRR